MSVHDTPKDLSTVTVNVRENWAVFSPSGFKITSEQYQETYMLMCQWNPLEVGGPKMAGLVERYLRTGDTHEEPDDPFAVSHQEGGFIDEW